MKDTMYAQVIRSFGGPEVFTLEKVPLPQPDPEEILVQTVSTSFNPADALARAGKFGRLVTLEDYRILGLDLAGYVAAVGSGVTQFRVGDAIFASLDIKRHGSYAQYVTLKAKDACIAPRNLPLEDVGTIPLTALTAYQGILDLGSLQSGQRVLIHGASGGVGLYAVQLALAQGAEVLATTSLRGKPRLGDFPVSQTIVYDEEDLVSAVESPVDLIYNLAPLTKDALPRLLGLLRDEGKFVSTTGIPDLPENHPRGLEIIAENAKRGGERLALIKNLLEEKKLRPVISAVYRLEDIPLIHTLHEEHRLQGKVCILLD
ncbi:NADP-dependent oxidoreductase [Proteiniclasticum sp. BAD-10]|uniref:NADP-dependent oxidoreductase n=1 Tax=Proteiniclasticum sediminis TaxID=2804028 RepID=A0A941CNP6_9CLOT|nr:NADP-dependent oxidoreductase [Proteiniclasticum sediminis]MBR0575244.1 NADP-dependent oxidoreductase [Proteiniclasticum sediminis]